jgi:hypothetical protein
MGAWPLGYTVEVKSNVTLPLFERYRDPTPKRRKVEVSIP